MILLSKIFTEKDALATGYILSSVDKNIQSTCDDFETTKEIMKHLEETFGKQDHLTHPKISSALSSAQMADSTSILDYIMRMNKYFQELEGYTSIFELDFKIEIIFATLPDYCYTLFIVNYHMNRVTVNAISELTNMLTEAEGIVKKSKAVALVTEKHSQSSKLKKKRKNKKNMGKRNTPMSKEGGDQKMKGKLLKETISFMVRQVIRRGTAMNTLPQ
ncbi:uncharacterized protein LOC122662936 [Telopea speciosissima]|uniref:uncharacterized protein LOC122662936 n=1 Tax=Telopea speciosissima TaxID=54955 RepID=UPI001CC5C720|nr:uncharacterized protein LOC122662936 [Telopea speciosissima]